MIIQKIEKLSQLSFVQQNPGESKAALQTCFYNLNNLKKRLQHHESDHRIIQKKKTQTLNEQKQANSQCLVRLPEISITNIKNHSMLGRNSYQSSREFRSVNYLHDIGLTKNSLCSISQSLLRNARINQILNKKSTTLQEQKRSKEKEDRSQHKENRLNKKISEFRKRKIQKAILGLPKNQRFYQETQVKVQEQVVQKLGLYEATNIYKANNVNKFLKDGYQDKFKPVINLKFATFSLCNRNQFFLTDNPCIPDINEADNYRQVIKRDMERKKTNESQKIKRMNQNMKEYNIVISTQKQRQITEKSQQSNLAKAPRNFQWIITIQNYEIVKNEQYFGFKKNNVEDWNQLNFILHKITLYLKKVKISLLSFKFQKQIFMKQLWYSSKIQDKALEKLLKIRLKVKNQSQKQKTIRLFNTKAEIIKQLVRLWKDRKNLEVRKKNKKKQKDTLNWMCLRMISRYKIKNGKKRAQERARVLNQKLRNGDWDHQVQIHIPSFSESEFVRDSTQYMEHYQNMFYHIWKSSNKQFILIIPAINQIILELFQQRIRLTKNISLICPQSHELYPKSLPLSASLLYSKDALCRVKHILEGKKGIIIPGRRAQSNSMYEYYLSQLLNCPLFTTLNFPSQIGDNKQLWMKYEIRTTNFTNIEPESTLENVIQKFSDLICVNPQTKVWILKMNGEFNGRGIAKFNADSSKKIKQIIGQQKMEQMMLNSKVREQTRKQIKKQIIAYLQIHFRLKLKINFQNCLFRVEEYIKKFLLQGGIIEEYIQDCQTYQFCFKLEPGYSNYSHLYILDELEDEKYICCTQNYEVDFVTKSSLFLNSNIPKILKDFSKKIERILKSQKYLGFVSVTVLYIPKSEQYFTIQIKPYMTINSSMNYFLKLFANKTQKQGTNRRIGNIVSHTQIEQKSESVNLQSLHHENNGLAFLFIPVIIFTDVDQLNRSQVIQSLVIDSWNKVPTKLFSQPIVANNPDSFTGHLYISLGLSLSLLIYGKPNDIKKMKKQAVDCLRELSDKIQSIKLYRGKKQIRDVFQFGDLIRAITKIRC